MNDSYEVPGSYGTPSGRRRVLAAAGVVALLIVLTAVVLMRQGSGEPMPPAAAGAPASASTSPDAPTITSPPTAKISGDPAATGPAPTITPSTPTRPAPSPPATTPVDDGALTDVATPITRPTCDGGGIVVLASAVTPGRYSAIVSGALARSPGSSYLRTDRSCPSLRQATTDGGTIYAVYRPVGAGDTDAICAAVAAAGGDAYGKRLDTTSDPSRTVTC